MITFIIKVHVFQQVKYSLKIIFLPLNNLKAFDKWLLVNTKCDTMSPSISGETMFKNLTKTVSGVLCHVIYYTFLFEGNMMICCVKGQQTSWP